MKRTFPRNLQYYRKLRGFSPAEVAQELNVSRQTYWAMENGVTEKISITHIQKLCKLFRIKVPDLIPEP